MDYSFAKDIMNANIKRTQYILSKHYTYSAQQSEQLDLQVSKAVLDILSFNISSRNLFSDEDIMLIDRCGPFLPPATLAAANIIKQFPTELSQVIYTVIYNQYFHNEGPAINLEQLLSRMDNEYVSTEENVYSYLKIGECMLASIMFYNQFLSSMQACFLMGLI